jgi:phosphoribosylformylglycinamidine synthase
VTVCSGSDALVLRIRCVAPQTQPTAASSALSPSTDKILALTHTHAAGFAYLDPYRAASGAVAEVVRDLACAGALPLGIVHNLSSGGPLDVETRRQREESARGVEEACRAFSLPAIAGEVLFGDETPDRARASSPVITAAGLVGRPEHVTTHGFKAEGDAILLLGEPIDTSDPMLGLGGSAYLQLTHGLNRPAPRRCDLERERELNLALRAWIHSGVVKSAHGCGTGGLAVALAECCLASGLASEARPPLGAQVDLNSFTLPNQAPLRLDALLFGETDGRILMTVPALQAAKVLAQAKILGVAAQRLGTVGGTTLSLAVPSQVLNWDLVQLAGLGAAPSPG